MSPNAFRSAFLALAVIYLFILLILQLTNVINIHLPL